jgi:hypothetical protein
MAETTLMKRAIVLSSVALAMAVACRQRSAADGAHVGAQTAQSIPMVPLTADVATARSTIIFSGHVLQLNARTEPDLPAVAGRTVVTVDQVFRPLPAFGHLVNDTITVLVSDSATVKVGDAALFYVVGVMLGEGIVVRELRREPMSHFATALQIGSVIATSDSAVTRATIAARSTNADGVVMGEVVADNKVAVSDSAERLRLEHAPEWGRAVVRVTAGFRAGDRAFAGRSIAVYHAVGGSVSNGVATTLAPGRHILWIHSTSRLSNGMAAGLNLAGAYYFLDARDVRAAGDSALVAQVLR